MAFPHISTTGRLKDFEKWTSMDDEYPPIGRIVEITDADCYGWADFVFHCRRSEDGFFYTEDGVKMCAVYTISYWKHF